MTDTALIDPGALRYAREQNRLSQRELGRRVAARLGRADAARAFQVRLSRIEKGDKVSEEDRALVDALAEELALGEGDLATPLKWIWLRPDGDRFTFLGFGLRMPAFSSPETAYERRDALAHATHGGSTAAFQDAQLIPIHGVALTKTVLDVNYGEGLADEEREFLLPLDPNLDDLRFLWSLQLALNLKEGETLPGGPYGDRLNLIDDAARFALDYPEFENELLKLHALALRRLQNVPAEAQHLLESWKREEHALFSTLDRAHELRRERRNAALEG